MVLLSLLCSLGCVGSSTPAAETLAVDFDRVGKIAVWHDRLYMTDQFRREIRIYASSGRLLARRQYASGRRAGEFLAGPVWIAANDSLVVVGDVGTRRVLTFDPSLNPIRVITPAGEGVTGVALTRGGRIAAGVWSGRRSSIEIFSSDGMLLQAIPVVVEAAQPFRSLFTMAQAAGGKIILAFNYGNEVWVMDSDFVVERRITVEKAKALGDSETGRHALHTNAIQCALGWPGGGVGVLLGTRSTQPRQELVLYSSSGNRERELLLPFRTYFGVVAGRRVVLVPEDRRAVVLAPIALSVERDGGENGAGKPLRHRSP